MVVGKQLLATMKKSFHFNLAASAEDEVIESWEEALSAKQEEVWALAIFTITSIIKSDKCFFVFHSGDLHHPDPVAQHVGPPLLWLRRTQRLPLLGADAAGDILQVHGPGR